MTTSLTADEVRLLEELEAAGQRGRWRTNSEASRAGFARLLGARYVTKQAASVDSVLYVITDLGRQALANAAK